MSGHAPLPPSAAARWGYQCPASACLEALYPDFKADDSEEAREWGNAAHWMAEFTLRASGPLSSLKGHVAPNGVVIDSEMIEAVETVTDDVTATLAKVGLGTDALHIEERVDCSWIHADNWGTPDLWALAQDGRGGGLLLLWDEKYGHGFVDAYENWQCIDYCAGILSRPEFRNLRIDRVSVVITIGQPRNYHPLGPIRRWEVNGADLSGYWQKLRNSAEEAMGPSPRTNVGLECDNCKARHACPALHRAADNAADIAGNAIPFELPPDALGLELRNLRRARDLLNARIDGLGAQAFETAKAGNQVPYFMLGRGESRERWIDEAAVIALDEACGFGISKPKLLTPNQARAAKVPAELVAAYSERPPGALKLIPADGANAARVFKKPQGV